MLTPLYLRDKDKHPESAELKILSIISSICHFVHLSKTATPYAKACINFLSPIIQLKELTKMFTMRLFLPINFYMKRLFLGGTTEAPSALIEKFLDSYKITTTFRYSF